MIYITDGQDGNILDVIPDKYIEEDWHERSLSNLEETYELITWADMPFSEYLQDRNRLLVPDEDGTYREFIITIPRKNSDNQRLPLEVTSIASYLEDLTKAKVIEPHKTESITNIQHVENTLEGTIWQPGNIKYEGIRTLTIEKNTNPFAFLKRLANEFKLEINFRIEIEYNRVVGRYVDMVERIGEWRGRTIEYGKDLLGIERTEDTSNVVTSLIGYGPERDDGTRLKVVVEDREALERWGMRDPKTGALKHLVAEYELQSNDQDMTLDRLRTLVENELEKRIKALVSYKVTFADVEHVPGLENEKVRFGDTDRIKDTRFNPPLYLEARVHKLGRSTVDKSRKQAELGDFAEYTEEEVDAILQSLQKEIRNRLSKLLVTTVVSSAGTTFKNGVGSTELSATVFLTGNETDKDGTIYDYKWSKRDKDGNLTSFEANGKTITVNAEDIYQKATYIVDVMQDGHTLSLGVITISNVFDGQDGERGPQGIQGPKGDDGKTLYVWRKYADDAQGNGMSDSPVGKAYMGLAYNKESPIQSNNPDDYEWSKYKGEQGVEGPKGDDGQTTYTWVKFADDKEGNGMSEEPDDKRYLGMAFNKTTPNESSNPSDYNWSPLYDNVQVGGRNLLRETQKEVKVISSSGWGDVSHPNGHDLLEKGVLQKGETYTFRVYLETDSYPVRCYIRIPSSSIPYRDFRGNNVPANSKGYSTVTFTVPDDAINATAFVVRFNQTDTPIQQVGYGEEKIEKGNIATDWTPAPEDERAYAEYVAQLKADLAEEEAKAHADGKVTEEEEARIRDAEEKLRQAKQHADTKSEEAKEGAKTDVESGTVNLPGEAVTGSISGKHLNIDLAVFGATPQFLSGALWNEGVWTIMNTNQSLDPTRMQTFNYFLFRPTKKYITVKGALIVTPLLEDGLGYAFVNVSMDAGDTSIASVKQSMSYPNNQTKTLELTGEITGHDHIYLRFNCVTTSGRELISGMRVTSIYMHD